MMRERVLRSLRITRTYVAPDRAVLLLGATPKSSVPLGLERRSG